MIPETGQLTVRRYLILHEKNHGVEEYRSRAALQIWVKDRDLNNHDTSLITNYFSILGRFVFLACCVSENNSHYLHNVRVQIDMRL